MAAHDVHFSRLPRHVGFIPDGNRRWAEARGNAKRDGYSAGIAPGLALIALCRDLGIGEVSIYGFTKDNVRRPSEQVGAFRQACVEFCTLAVEAGAALRVIGDADSPAFPADLAALARTRSAGMVRVNLLVNYGWQWDLNALERTGRLASADVPRIDLLVRWGGRRRLSGFLPVQCTYADIYVVDSLWPDFTPQDFVDALHWYQAQDVTLGG